MADLRGFGITFDVANGGFRNWYIDGEGAKRWADNDEIVRGPSGQHPASASPLEDAAPPSHP